MYDPSVTLITSGPPRWPVISPAGSRGIGWPGSGHSFKTPLSEGFRWRRTKLERPIGLGVYFESARPVGLPRCRLERRNVPVIEIQFEAARLRCTLMPGQ